VLDELTVSGIQTGLKLNCALQPSLPHLGQVGVITALILRVKLFLDLD